MGRCQDLNLVVMCGLQDHSPVVTLYRMVNTVLGFIDEQKTVPAVGEGQSNTEQSEGTISEASQRDRRILAPEPDHRPSPATPGKCRVVADYRDTLNVITEYQPQGVYCPLFIVRKRHAIP